MSGRPIGSVLALLLLAGCAESPAPVAPAAALAQPAPVTANGKVRVVAEVTAFHPQGMFDDFADGTSTAYDLTVLTVREPADLAGKTVSVVHDTPAPEGSIWRVVGAFATVEVDRTAVGNDAVTVNAAAVQLINPSRQDAR